MKSRKIAFAAALTGALYSGCTQKEPVKPTAPRTPVSSLKGEVFTAPGFAAAPTPAAFKFPVPSPTPYPAVVPEVEPTPVLSPELRALASRPKKATPQLDQLSEKERRSIFYALVSAEDRALKDAERRYPLVDLPDQHLAEYDRLADLYTGREKKRIGLQENTFKAISEEGVLKHWPPLQP